MVPTQAPLQKLRFGQGTVPGLKLDGSDKVIDSRAILRRSCRVRSCASWRRR